MAGEEFDIPPKISAPTLRKQICYERNMPVKEY
jgi:hypothetical protein